MYDILHDTKCVTFYMMQNAGCATWHKMYDMLHGENMLHVTWRTMCDMLHDTKCMICYMGKNMLHDAQCVTCYMTENVWHVTCHKKMSHVTCNKECDVLHAAKTINNTSTN